MKKKVILTFSGYYLPGYKAGGPIRTIANMVDHLNSHYDFYIVTSDRDALEDEPFANLGDTTNWKKIGQAQVLYLSPRERTFKKIAHIIQNTPHDVLYLNSFFSFNFSIKPLLLRRLGLVPSRTTVLAPRGEFSKGALSYKSPKKNVFLLASHALKLHENIRWQVSSAHEKEDLLREVKIVTVEDVYVAINLPDLSSLAKAVHFNPRRMDEPLKIIFLSRISPMKNLDYALELMQRSSEQISFHIYGLIDNSSYYEKCRVIIESLPANVKVKYMGPIEHSAVIDTIAGYDLFILPTKGENFGHVILEALTAGTPVLISDQTPWRDLEEKHAGWAFPLDNPVKFVEKIRDMARLTREQQLFYRGKAREYAKFHLLDAESVERNIKLFK